MAGGLCLLVCGGREWEHPQVRCGEAGGIFGSPFLGGVEQRVAVGVRAFRAFVQCMWVWWG